MSVITAAKTAKKQEAPPRETTDRQVMQLLDRYRLDRSESAREALVLIHRPLVEKVARRFLDTGEPLEDLVQEGFLGLLTALDLFDSEFSVKFTTYAHHLITGQIRHYLRDKGTIIREPAWSQDLRRTIRKTAADLTCKMKREPTIAELAAACNVTEDSLSEVLQAEQVAKVASLDGYTDEDSPAVDPDKIRSLRHVSFQMPLEDKIVLEELVANLKQIEQRVVHDFFFLDLSQTEIARALGVSCNYVSHLLKSAIKKLGKSMAYAELQERQLRQRRASDEDHESSIVDRVTGLYTASYYMKRLEEEIARSRRYRQDLSTVWVRALNFAECQARFGVDWGDRTLHTIGCSLREGVRRCDIVCHLGDATFAIILPHTGDGAKVVRDRTLSSLGAIEYGRGASLEFRGVSLGISSELNSVRALCETAEYQLMVPF